MAPPKVLVIAGSDSSGGAGLEADQKVLAAHGCYAMTATTALTAQNTLGVQDVHVTPPAFVGKQIDACLTDISCDAVKLGVATTSLVITTLAYNCAPKVMVSTSGHQLLPGDAIRNLRDKLLPITTLLTPNIPEATLLLRDADIQYKSPSSLEDLKSLAKMVHQLGPRAVLVKGGHMPLTKTYTKAVSDDEKLLTVDVLYDGSDYTIIESKYLRSKNTHGTGCSLASAIAANLAIQKSTSTSTSTTSSSSSSSSSPPPSLSLSTATRLAVHYVSAGIETAHADMGSGSGPINHFHNVQTLPFSRGHFIEYLLSHPSVQRVWHAYTHHAFAEGMARGTLSEGLFKNYLVQDYLYLTHFARTHALAAYKSHNMTTLSASADIILHIRREMDLHLSYCADFGITKDDLEHPRLRESMACVAYSRYVLDVGHSEDWLAIQMALAPCLLGYGETARRLYADPQSKTTEQGNKYWRWVENYVADDYTEAVRVGRDLIEQHITKQSPSRIEELVNIFVRATEMEVRFWDFDAHPD
ncbi:trifunctional hydroxymethylpyrimidine kinase/phosphomethylpyrimidine kinase/thiaminase [Exophiala xenobiotica]|uniref:Trifunctional hydroxymethylpyrimidine kinase/phosphomethylpyrimidine kinase/thiaminase n=1 Tax=Vermiconidia calcicola TaxID=1690605 RepID=A0AAV9QJ31_9PEZI|nr:trifunctional hydroxymethylpyrimidine kinase/phosphomethylpyrimidine kinase/thiaminase [Exophiala xenobiotica]KAK5543750.1 trifunctional hydroxymethylpyrimidine kinase/phosphomethylpyrimidine kinase/thiaminase [Vermiconidia calcicola]KAK5231264.1 trifunctional hydroxymethylpyrimidine kinase/phosphomethylpyrimidine kinase/thiaminase [Exophiala xenobiotica]KAK5250988.1 trifunctional hydroxymethylpyrimidine kinase/phosphomethylpyrimidine kinase/thiaminase [Exophiala xenobiotica]KAK5282272.1 tri